MLGWMDSAWEVKVFDIYFFHFMCGSSLFFLLLSDNVQVKYRSKVVKYIWPMPHHADSIPWVQVKLANGDTLKTKLLVSLFLRHTHTHSHLSLSSFFFTSMVFFFDFFRLVQMDPTPWWEKAWEYPQWSGIMTSLLWWPCCTCQRWVLTKLSGPLSLVKFCKICY